MGLAVCHNEAQLLVYGLAFAYRLNNKNSLKAAYTNGLFTASGADFNTYLIAYQFLWFDKN